MPSYISFYIILEVLNYYDSDPYIYIYIYLINIYPPMSSLGSVEPREAANTCLTPIQRRWAPAALPLAPPLVLCLLMYSCTVM